MKKIFVRVTFHDDEQSPHDSASVEVFIEPTDSYTEIRQRAVAKARGFFGKALASPSIETPE
jgi:hypothetical protein